MLWMVPVVSTSWQSSACSRVNLVSGESGEEDVEGRGCRLVEVVRSLTYLSTLSTNLGMCS